MLNLFETIIHEHDQRLVALALGICAISTLTGTAIAQMSMKADLVHRRGWLILAGVVTGLGVWTTHFTAMLGYRNNLDIHFDLSVSAYSLVLAIGFTVAGGLVGLQGKERGILAGAFVGVGIAVAHFLDMHALRFAGSVVHDPLITLFAGAVGLVLAAWAGHLLLRWRDQIFAWPAAIALSAAILSFHFIAMSGVRIVPAEAAVEMSGWTASVDELATIIVVAFLLMLGAAVTYTWHSERLARATARQQRRLIHTLETLRETQDHHRAYIELNPQIAWVADRYGMITEVAPLWGELVGLPREASYGEGWAKVVHPDDLPLVTRHWRAAIEAGDGDSADVRYRLRMSDGAFRWYRARARPRHDAEGNVVAWYGSLEDIHDQVLGEEALRSSEERYRLASRATSDVIWDWSFQDQRATWAGAYKKVLGYPELQSETDFDWWLDRIHPDDRSRVLTSQSAALKGGAEYWHEEYRFRIATGEWIDVKTRCVIVRDGDERPIRLVGSMLDVTQQKTVEAELNWAALHDPLTKLPNRTLYRKRKRAAIDDARQSGGSVALIVLDLNNFKELNDTLGHAAGDRVLEQTAQRLLESLPHTASVARLGGDEFAIILPELSEPDAYAGPMSYVSTAMEEPFLVGDTRVPVNFSAGVALWPRDGEDPAELLIAADLALYSAKEEMPGTFMEFTPTLRGASERRSQMLFLARQALEQDSIVPFYQPKIDLRTGRVMGWEALLRICSADGTILPPSEIQAAFSDSEVAVRLTERMFARVFADLANWRAVGIDPGRIAVNLSAADFRGPDLASRLQAHAEATEQGLSAIDIEVTETVLIGQLGPEVSRMLQELRKMGVMVALDDFGTGYASLTHLQEFPVDVIKIDKSFIERIDENNPKATAVIDAVLEMAMRLGMQTVAEGIETMEQARYLRARGCTMGQGYFFDRPLPACEVPRALSSETKGQWEVVRLRSLKSRTAP
ncbi:EAL domain-containing protein [Aquamicrobium sp. cd-1]|uniref:EAL domain-containing protein n=1 Tax=Aquamicrobium zhengzhouense TaxID=2781738 RepID=A0ABS0SC31_9HYPH|nr:EAL domain-containing protein [Aquamicrobium zhengzhouense]